MASAKKKKVEIGEMTEREFVKMMEQAMTQIQKTLPCQLHTSQLARIMECIERTNVIVEKLQRCITNGEGGLVTQVAVVKARLHDLEERVDRHIGDSTVEKRLHGESQRKAMIAVVIAISSLVLTIGGNIVIHVLTTAAGHP